MEPTSFSELPRFIQFQTAVFGPLLFGLVCGFLLGESELGYWLIQAVGAALAVAGGAEHDGPAAGARRGLVTATMFALGIVLADAISGDAPTAKVPEPIGLIVVPIAIGGTTLGALGGRLRERRLG
jgi:ABC-type Mn2+/Zn2+ transport system permease subunit